MDKGNRILAWLNRSTGRTFKPSLSAISTIPNLAKPVLLSTVVSLWKASISARQVSAKGWTLRMDKLKQ